MARKLLSLSLIAILYVSGEAWGFYRDAGGPLPEPQISKVRQKNSENVDRLRVGMDEKEVSKLMGDRGEVQTYNLRQKAELLSNPVRVEKRSGKDGSKFTVRYYFAYQKKADAKITTDELCPVVLREGVLTGWGWEYYEKEIGPMGQD